VIPEPLASLVQHRIQGTAWSDLWQTSNGCGRLEVMHLDKDGPQPVPTANGKLTVNGMPAKAVNGTLESRIDPAASAKSAHAPPAVVYRGAKVKPQ
jgi:hypothetical protein